MAFGIPNVGTLTFPTLAEPDAQDWEALVRALQGPSGQFVISGGAVTAPNGNMTVSVTAASVWANSTQNSVAANTSLAVTAADATKDRFTLVYVTSGGVLSTVDGTAVLPVNSQPVAVYPAIPAGGVLLAAVYVPHAATSLTSDNVQDKRFILPELTFPGSSNGANMRDPLLDRWYKSLAAENIDVLCIGDSISALGGAGNVLDKRQAAGYPWPWRVYFAFNQRSTAARNDSANVKGIYSGQVYAGGIGGFVQNPASLGGASNGTHGVLSGLGNWTESLNAGQAITGMTITCTTFAIVWTRKSGGGTLTIADGTGTLTPASGDGISGSTIVTSGASTAYSRITYFNQRGGFGTQTISVTASVANCQVEAIVPFTGNQSTGIRFWMAGHTGYTTALATNDGAGSGAFGVGSGYCLDFIQKVQPALVIDNMGFNDIEANVAADKAAFYAAIRSASPNTQIVLVSAWTTASKCTAFRTAAATASVAFIDVGSIIGSTAQAVDNFVITGDGVHPNSTGSQLIADIMEIFLSGDPLGTMASMLQRSPRIYAGTFVGDTGTFSGLVAALGAQLGVSGLTFTGAVGKGDFIEFVSPLFRLFAATADASPMIALYTAGIATALGFPGATMVLATAAGASPHALSWFSATEFATDTKIRSPLAATATHLASLGSVAGMSYAVSRGVFT